MADRFQYGFIGCGNMVSAIIQGMISSQFCPSSQIGVSSRTQSRIQALSKDTDIVAVQSNQELAQKSSIIIVGVKPAQYPTVLHEITSSLHSDTLIVSITPSFTLAQLQHMIDHKCHVLRAMPNTPLAVGCGMTAICAPDDVPAEIRQKVVDLFSSCGRVEVIPETLMDVVPAASGSSPAFFFIIAEAMADAVVMQGMPRQQAYSFVAQTMLGSAKMILESGKHPGQLKDEVCSPGGSTIAGIAKLEEMGLRGTIISGMNATWEKIKEMGKKTE
ncbi:pyrroline-5-carboxylate reductase [Blattamonas nauphoetae]|uniref:Pyrroline-5-carboxylate reductase n=1 Tax=Blattamonas nauphoetae TaxID=2049346 RepID=A0ABQ9X2S8_9EUKA|nr:pyrroline-5-carboxylate reductase [Blattamonas nauphoetae]